MLQQMTKTETSLPADERLSLTAQLVSAYVGNNDIALPEFIDLIGNVYKTLETLDQTALPSPAKLPAVPIPESIQDEYLVCLEDGKRFKSLKRHIRARYNLSPEQYRKKWGLPDDYPMVAPSYARKRSRLAKQMGLGRPGV